MKYAKNQPPFNCLAIKLYYMASDVTRDQPESGLKENEKITLKLSLFLKRAATNWFPCT